MGQNPAPLHGHGKTIKRRYLLTSIGDILYLPGLFFEMFYFLPK